MNQPLLKCEHVDFGYENYDVVKDVSMEINPGDYLCIVGENGSGKSTLMKGLLGLIKPTGGVLTLADELRRSGIGYLPQQTPAQKDFPATVQEVVISGCLGKRGNRPFYSMEERKLAAVNMEKLGITDLKKSCYRDLSGGQKQRTLIARALCATDKLLILDEPITGLDPASTQDFYAVIRHLNRDEKVAVLMVSHDIGNIVTQANKILQLKQTVQFYGTVDEYKKSEFGREFLGGENSMGLLQDMFSYPFLVRAMIGGICISLCASLLGVSLVLKRYSMIGDGLSHVSFGALSIAVAFNWAPLAVSIPVVAAAAVLLLRITGNGKIKSDAAIAMISAGSLAIGIIVTSLTTGMTTDVSSYMFGSILAMSREDMYLSVVLSLVVLGMFVICYNKVFAVTFDESFAKATGVRVSAYNLLIAVLTAITIVLGMRMMGAMLISSLVIFPALTSMRVFKSFLGVVVSSGVVSVVCFFIGLILSYVYSIPAGASVVVVNLAMFGGFSVVQMVKQSR